MTVKWNNLNKIAAHVGRTAPFPDDLPDVTVCDFDEVKNLCCIHRVGRLCSVDTVLVGKDGRLYFVEFKDSNKNPISNLKKKAFDSLSVFWMTLGRDESIESICSRAVFVYVKPDSEKKTPPSSQLAENFLLNDAKGLTPPKSKDGKSIEYWLNDFKVTGLYLDVELMTTSDFVKDFPSRFELGEEVSFAPSQTTCSKVRTGFVPATEKVFLNQLLTRDRTEMGCGGVDFCDDDIEAVNFRDAAGELLKSRMYLPEEDLSGTRRDMLYVATAFRNEVLYTYHNWERIENPLGRLVNCVFDSAYLAAWIFSPQTTFLQAVENLSAVVTYDGDFVELKRSPNVVWLQEFYDNFVKWFNRETVSSKCPDVEFGLGCFVADGLYDNIVTTNQLPISVK